MKKNKPELLGEVIKGLIQQGLILPNYKLNNDGK